MSFLRDFLSISKHWPLDNEKRWPSLKNVAENLALYPLYAVFIAASKSFPENFLPFWLPVPCIIFAVIFTLMLATAVQTISLLLSIFLGSVHWLVPKNEVFRIPGVGLVPEKIRPYIILSAIIILPILMFAAALALTVFSMSSAILGLLKG